MDADTVFLIIIDPPYNEVLKNDWDQKEELNDKLIIELFRILKDTGSIYIWCGIGEKSQSLMRWWPMLSKHFFFKDLITWKKQRGIGMRKGWLYTREEIMWFVKNNKKFIWNQNEAYSDVDKYAKIPKGFKMSNGEYSGQYLKNKDGFKRITNIWTDITEESFNTSDENRINLKHPSVKPLKAIERIIKSHTQINDIVFDCFLGSGTTCLAAKNLGRNFIGIEKDLGYFNIAQDRIGRR